MKNLIQRTITGVLFVAILVGCILYGPLSFVTLFAFITGLTVWEFAHLVNQEADVQINRLITTTGGIYLFVAVFCFCTEQTDARIFIPYLLILIYLMVSELYLKRENPVNNWAYSFMSQLYVALPFALLNVLAFQRDNGSPNAFSYNAVLPLAVFIFNWVNDTGAYCTGTLFGKHRLFERISPKKSWEGSIGGGVLCILVSLLMAHFFPFLSELEWIGFALVVVIFGTWGDLVESLFKRHLGIKDSGHILPGHGGMLDRFDSTLLAIPAVVLYLYTLNVLAA